VVYKINTPGIADLAVTNDQIATSTIEVTKLNANLLGALVPIGGIIMWSGTEDQIAGFPNWQLCDGSAISSGSLSGTNTPDLVGRFILGTDTYDTGEGRWEENITGDSNATGGSKDAIVVSHDHDVSNDSHNHGVSNDSHSHGDSFSVGRGTLAASTSGDASHTHTVEVPAGAAQGGGGNPNYWQGSQTISTQSNTGDHDHNISMSGSPSFTGSVSANSTGATIDNNSTGIIIDTEGSSGTNKNLPPYYSLAYIMRVA
jgi:hypothetical protein